MNSSSKKWRFAMMPVALTAMVFIPLQGCEQLQEAQSSLCCSEFTPGADLAAVNWELDADAELNFGAFMQATSDFTGAATALISDVSNACQAIAVDLGAGPSEVKATKPDERASAWCALAVAKINEAGADLKITFQPPSCTINASVQASCEARCSAKVECEITPGEIIARCDPGKLSGKCSAECSGTCEGSANLAVNCEGSCQGTCQGDCSAGCSTMQNGQCNGACSGKCTGECRGSCQVEAGAQVQCNGDCTGGCSVEVTAPKCKAELKPPSAECQGNAECSGSCQASASAKAECKEPSIEIEGKGNIDALVATLKINLPKLILVAKVRGELLIKNAEAVVEASGNLQGAIGGSVKATACLIPAGAAIGQALSNVEAGFSASVKVMGSVNIGM